MRLRKRLFGLGCSLILSVGGAAAWAAGPAGSPMYGPVRIPAAPYCPQPGSIPVLPSEPRAPTEDAGRTPLEQPGQPEPEAPTTDAFDAAPESGTESAQSFAPQMIGDFRGLYGNTIVPIQTGTGVTFTRVQEPWVGRGAFLIAENESPQPQNRVFMTYNYYNHLPASSPGGFSMQDLGDFNVPAGNIRIEGLDVHQSTFGFEKTIFGPCFSVGMRVPIFWTGGGNVELDVPTTLGSSLFGAGSIQDSDLGDLTIVTKLALSRDPTGGVFSVGLAISAPTGPGFFVTNPNIPVQALLSGTLSRTLIFTRGNEIHSTLFQPYFGLFRTNGSLYLHGFTSVVVPTDGRDVIMLSNDYGFGWFMYQRPPSRMISSITPTAEVHVATPLNNRDATDIVYLEDQVVFTGGVHLGLWQRARLTFGAAVPCTGPQPFDVEAIGQLNVRF